MIINVSTELFYSANETGTMVCFCFLVRKIRNDINIVLLRFSFVDVINKTIRIS